MWKNKDPKLRFAPDIVHWTARMFCSSRWAASRSHEAELMLRLMETAQLNQHDSIGTLVDFLCNDVWRIKKTTTPMIYYMDDYALSLKRYGESPLEIYRGRFDWCSVYPKLWVAEAFMIFGVDSLKKAVIFSLFGIFKSWVGLARFTTRNPRNRHVKVIRIFVEVEFYQSMWLEVHWTWPCIRRIHVLALSLDDRNGLLN